MTCYIGLVPCGAKKREYPCPARDMYISYHSRVKIEYVDLFCEDWLMVTSKYGPCFPEQIIAPYDDYLGKRPQKDWRTWFDSYFPEPFLSMLYRGREGKQIAVLSLLPSAFRKFLHPAIKEMGIPIVDPVSHLKIGPCSAWLLSEIQKQRPEQKRPTIPRVMPLLK